MAYDIIIFLKLMVRLLFSFILLIHGLIHLLGFVHAYNLAKIEGFTGKTLLPLSSDLSKIAGIGWLAACILFLGTTTVFLLKKEGWWMVAIPAVLLSQMLIVLYWQDAKFGTIANILTLAGIILAYGSWHFHTMVNQELTAFKPGTKTAENIVSKEMLAPLPPVVQKWLTRSQITGKVRIHTVHLKQSGKMRTKPEGNWMPVKATQYFTTDQPGFLWIADVKAAPFIHLSGRDKYLHGKGHMRIQLLSLIPVADAQGEKTDQGTLLRYLAEIIWFPTAALSSYINWEPVNTTQAKATMHYGKITASGIFTFNETGDVVSFEAQRYYDRKEGPTLEKWLITIDPDSYTAFDGIRIPVKAEVTWRLQSGDFTWYKLEITDVVYNQATAVTEPLPTYEHEYE